jgi:hypothetical protein
MKGTKRKFTFTPWEGLPKAPKPEATPAKKPAPRVDSEEVVHRKVCLYLHQLRLRDDRLHFNTDLSGIRMSRGVAGKVKDLRSQPGWPDLMLMHPSAGILYVDLKREGTRLRNRNKLWADDHVAEQAYMLRELRANGVQAVFAIGYTEAKDVIDRFLAGQNVNALSLHQIN